MEYFVIIIIVVFAFNLILLVYRRLKNRDAIKSATEARIKAQKNLEDTKRRLSREQEQAEHYVSLQNKMLDMYEQVRQDGGNSVPGEDFEESENPSEHDS